MDRKATIRPLLPLFFLFFLINVVLILLKIALVQGISYPVLVIGNAILFFASLLSFFLYRKALFDKNPQVFLRFLYGGMLIRMSICLLAALLYIFLTDGGVNRNAVLECFVLYFIYTFVEVRKLMRMSKEQKNA